MSTTAPPADPATGRPAAAARGRRSTPALYRLGSLTTIAALALAAIVSFLAARSLTEATDRAENNTGPVLVAVQDVFASIAEADAASAAVFLSAVDEDREQRRLYEVALQRSTAQLEEVSRLVGDDDDAHESIKAIGAGLTEYSGQVEAARLANLAGLDGATDRLEAAISTVQDDIVPEVANITDGAQDQLDDDVTSGRVITALALLAVAAALSVLGLGQMWLSRRTNRLLNLPMVVASALVALSLVWLLTSWVRQQSDLGTARDDGYDSIALTSEIQTTAFRYKTLESLSVVGTTDPSDQDDLAADLADVAISPEHVGAARTGVAAEAGLLFDAVAAADTTRERAATSEMLVRWQRYLDTSRAIQTAIDNGERVEAVGLAVGPGNADFNGFNTSVESVLSDNRSQFTTGLARAGDRLRWLTAGMIALPALAAVLVLWGWQLRISEYSR